MHVHLPLYNVQAKDFANCMLLLQILHARLLHIIILPIQKQDTCIDRGTYVWVPSFPFIWLFIYVLLLLSLSGIDATDCNSQRYNDSFIPETNICPWLQLICLEVQNKHYVSQRYNDSLIPDTNICLELQNKHYVLTFSNTHSIFQWLQGFFFVLSTQQLVSSLQTVTNTTAQGQQ